MNLLTMNEAIWLLTHIIGSREQGASTQDRRAVEAKGRTAFAATAESASCCEQTRVACFCIYFFEK